MPANKIKIEPAMVRRKAKRLRKKRITSCKILIVCEGEKTEPNYFKKFDNIDNGSFIYELDIEGGGINTIDVVKKAIELRDANSEFYDSVWAVFDKDSFPNNKFNSAILKAKANNINVAWSNEAFEIWYLFHFCDRITSMSRHEYKEAISRAVKASPKWKKSEKYVYLKNDPNNYSIMNKYGSQDSAIKRSIKQEETFNNEKFHSHNPCTTVYKLVNQLLNNDQELIKSVMAKINAKG